MTDPLDVPITKEEHDRLEREMQDKMSGLFFETEPANGNDVFKLTDEHLKNSVVMMNERYLKKVLLGTETKEEKQYLGRLEDEMVRRAKLEGKDMYSDTPSLFGDDHVET